MMEINDYKKWELDIRNTIIANLFGFSFMCVVFLYIVFTISFISEINDINTKLIGLIVFMFSVIKLMQFIGHPYLEYKERRKKK